MDKLLSDNKYIINKGYKSNKKVNLKELKLKKNNKRLNIITSDKHKNIEI